MRIQLELVDAVIACVSPDGNKIIVVSRQGDLASWDLTHPEKKPAKICRFFYAITVCSWSEGERHKV